MASASAGSVTEIVRNRDLSVRITRRFEAPPALVFKMFIDPVHFTRWFGPEGHDVVDCVLDSKIGGRFYAELKAPTGNHHRVQGIFKEVRPHDRVAFTWNWLGEDGKPRNPSTDTLVTVDLVAMGTDTELTLTHTGFQNEDQQSKHNSGWNSSFVCLGRYLPETAA
jgi:uncharacterized protein YndB with AHSA1/START domain